MYARSDVLTLHIPAQAGGCGHEHVRPSRDGTWEKTWHLDCPPCEGYLRGEGRPKILRVHPGDVKNGIAARQEWVADSDPHWAATPESVPMTPDEQRADARFRETAQRQIDAINALGAAVGNGLAIPPEMMYLLRKQLPADMLLPGSVLCASGHDNPPGGKFCSTCGTPMDARTPAAELETAAPADGDLPDLDGLHPQTLSKLCRSKGVPDRGSRAEMIARLRG